MRFRNTRRYCKLRNEKKKNEDKYTVWHKILLLTEQEKYSKGQLRGWGTICSAFESARVRTEALKKLENKVLFSTQVYNKGKREGDWSRVKKTTVITNIQESHEKKAVQE